MITTDWHLQPPTNERLLQRNHRSFRQSAVLVVRRGATIRQSGLAIRQSWAPSRRTDSQHEAVRRPERADKEKINRNIMYAEF